MITIKKRQAITRNPGKKIELERLSEAAIKRRLVITRPDPTTNPPTDRASDTLKDSANSDKTDN
jgi:hypothetical protein